MDKLSQLKDNIKIANTHLSECEKICNQIKRLLKFKGIKKNDVDIYIQVFKDTIYERMYEVINNKSNIINQIIKKENEK